MSGLDKAAAEKSRHIADLARRRGLLADQTRARSALDALMRGDTGNLSVEGVRAVLLDEAQDLTPIEFALLLELPRLFARRDQAAQFIAAGDESQTVHPSGFEWGVAKDLIRERLGREPKDIVLGHMMRSPDAILSIINKTGSLYKTLPKNFRPGGAVAHNAPPTDDAGRVLQCEVPENGSYADLVEALVMNPGRAVITLEPPPSGGKDHFSPNGKSVDKNVVDKGAAVSFTPAEIKGLERRIVVVTGLDETLSTLNRLTTRSAQESRSLESLEARYLIDGVRVALSRATETLIILHRDSDRMTHSPVDLVGGAETIEWEELLRFVREDDLSDEERAEGFLEEAREYAGRSDTRRALERLDRAEDIVRGLSDEELLVSIRALRLRLEKKAKLRIVVAPQGGDFVSLQDALDSAAEGALIQVRPGTYQGPFMIDRDVKIVGDGPRDSVVLEADMGTVFVHSCTATLEGLTIHRREVEGGSPSKFDFGMFKKLGRWAAKAAGIPIQDDMFDAMEKLLKSDRKLMAVGAHDAQLHIRGCKVTSERGLGIFGTMSRVYVESCVVHDIFAGIIAALDCVMTIERTEVKGAFTGIVAGTGARLVVRESSVHNAGENCILLGPGSEARIENNELRSAKLYGIFVASGVVTMVVANRIHRCYGGIKLDDKASGIFEGNDIAESEHVGFWVAPAGDATFRSNRVRNGGKYGVFIDPTGGGTFEENQIVDNEDTGLMISGEGVIVVRSSLIQGNAKSQGPATSYPSVFIGAKVVGLFEDNEVCHTQGRGIGVQVNAGAEFVVRKNRVHHQPLQGIVCRGIDCVVEDNEIFENGNVGLCVEQGGSPKARRNRIHHNGAGIVVREGGSGLFEDNDVHMQKDVGVAVDHSNGTFRKNRISKATRFAVYVFGTSEPLFEDNEISASGLSNGGANVCVAHEANPVLRGNTIQGGSIGIVFTTRAQGLAEGNEIDASARIGVFVEKGATPILRKNRIHDSKDHGVIIQVERGVVVEDNEVFRNRGMGIRIDSLDIAVRGNWVHDNFGGGIAAQPKTKGVFERNRIIDNKKWGFMVAQEADPTLRDNQVQGSLHGIVVCHSARGTYISNDVRGNERLGLHIDPGSMPVRCEDNISDGGAAGRLGTVRPTHYSQGKKKGRGK